MNRYGIRTWWFAVLIVLASLAIAAPASAASGSKPYSLTIAPGSTTYEKVAGEVASGQTVDITATFKNETSTQQLGSADLFWPNKFNVTSVTFAPSSVGSGSVGKSCTYLGAQAGPCVQLRGLSLQPGSSVTVTMVVTTPACVAGSGNPWFAEAKQANNYSGSPGNDLTPDPGNSQLNTTLDGACKLSWSTDPNNAQTNAVITSKSYDTSGAAPAVTVQDLGGNPVNTSTAPVTVGLATNLFATLNGTLTEPADGTTGTAAFADMSIGEPATGYELGATSGTLAGATSSGFNVTDEIVNCDPNNPSTCNVTDGTPNGNQAKVTATPTTSGLLLESVNANNSNQLTCAGYTSVDPNTYQFETPTGWGKIVTLTIRPLKKIGGNANQILKAQQICLGAPDVPGADFITASGAPAPLGTLPDGSAGFIGLLPDCGGSITGPCHNRKSDTTISDPLSPNGFDLVLVANIPASFAGDPHMR